MSSQVDFVNAVNGLLETLAPNTGPSKIIEFNDNVVNPNNYTALVLCWSGTTSNQIYKRLYKVWCDSTSVLHYAQVDSSNWPAGI